MIRCISYLLAGNALGQLIQIFSQPVLARIYEVSDFGVFAQINAISTIATVLVTLQVPVALVVVKDDTEAQSLFSVGMALSTGMAVALFLIALQFNAAIFSAQPGYFSCLLCFLFTLELGFVNLLRGWQTAKGYFRTLSMLSVIRSAVLVATQICFGVFNVSDGLIYGLMLSEMSVLSYLFLAGQTPGLHWSAFGTFQKIAAQFRKYRDFMLTGTVQELVSVTVLMIPMYMFTHAYDSDVGGQYSMAYKLIWAPVTLVGGAVSQVVYHNFSNISEVDLRCSRTLQLGTRFLCALLVGGAGFMIAPVAFEYLLGLRWAMAGKMAAWIVLWGTVFLLSVPHRVCYRVFRLQRIQLAVDAIVLGFMLYLFRCSANIAPLKMLAYISTVGVLQNLVLIALVVYFLKSRKPVNPTYSGVKVDAEYRGR